MSKCTILIGAPATGKSTWCDTVRTSVILSSDAVIEDIAEQYGFTYDQVFSDLIRFAETVFWRKLYNWAEQGVDLVIDRTNMSVKSRKKIIDLLKPHGYQFEAVVFPVPGAQEWRRRLDNRKGKTIPEHVLHSIAGSYVEPTDAEGFSKITFCDYG
jgi:predicted kinase